MKKPSYYPVLIIIISLILFLVASLTDILPLQIKLIFLAKVGIVVGFIGLWIFTLLPMWGNKKES